MYKSHFFGDKAAWRMALCCVLYTVASLHHTGQSSELYAILGWLSELGFTPSPLGVELHGIEELMYSEVING